VHRVVGDVHDVVAGFGARREHGRDAGYRVGTAVDDAVEVDEEQEGHRSGC